MVGVPTVDNEQSVNGEGIYPIKIDAEERRIGQESGLDTLVLLSVNNEWQSLKNISVNVNTLTIPPCEYDCKIENKKISRFRSERSEACYLIR